MNFIYNILILSKNEINSNLFIFISFQTSNLLKFHFKYENFHYQNFLLISQFKKLNFYISISNQENQTIKNPASLPFRSKSPTISANSKFIPDSISDNSLKSTILDSSLPTQPSNPNVPLESYLEHASNHKTVSQIHNIPDNFFSIKESVQTELVLNNTSNQQLISSHSSFQSILSSDDLNKIISNSNNDQRTRFTF
jgi:hypothetical protein